MRDDIDLLAFNMKVIKEAIPTMQSETVANTGDFIAAKLAAAFSEHAEDAVRSVTVTRGALEKEVFDILDLIDIAYEKKKQQIEKLRGWRQSIQRETSDAADAITRMERLFSTRNVDELMNKMAAFCDTCEKLNLLHQEGFFNIFQIKP